MQRPATGEGDREVATPGALGGPGATSRGDAPPACVSLERPEQELQSEKDTGGRYGREPYDERDAA